MPVKPLAVQANLRPGVIAGVLATSLVYFGLAETDAPKNRFQCAPRLRTARPSYSWTQSAPDADGEFIDPPRFRLMSVGSFGRALA